MKTTDTMRRALAWCDRRGLSPTTIHDDGDIEIHTRGRAGLDSRDGFVATARAAGVLNVSAMGTVVVAYDEVDGFDVAVFAGSWTRELDEAARLTLAYELRRELLAVVVPA